jgi:hypothetical protein
MSAPPITPNATAWTAPSQGRARAGVAPSAGVTPEVGRLLALVRWIITYGQQLATILQQGADPGRFAVVALRFQTTDLAAVLARIARGLMLAGALEVRLMQLQRRGRDVRPVPIRMSSAAPQRDSQAPIASKPRHTNIIDLPLDRLPSASEIAAELRRRPIGAVLVDICRDLCMQPADAAYGRWEELAVAIVGYGGGLLTLLFRCPLHDKVSTRAGRPIAGNPADVALQWVIPPLPVAAATRPTGPPDDTRQRLAA